MKSSALGLLLVVTVLAGACNGSSSDTTISGGGPGQTVAAGCVEVPVATSPEKFTLLTDLAAEFNATGFEVDGQCASVTVYRVSSGVAANLLSAGWPEGIPEGPQPVLWSPAASSWGSIVNQRLSEAGEEPIANDFERIMLTPLVLGMPRPMAEALGWPEAEIGWGDVLELSRDPDGWGAFGHPEWGPFRLGKTNPNFSTSGLSATVATFYGATGKTSGLTLDDVGSTRVREFVTGVEESVVHYGDTTLTFLDNMLREDLAGRPLTYVSAVAVEEVSILAYNRGDPADTGDEGLEPPNVPLVAVYPKEGTLFSDNPAYVLDAPWVTDVQREAALAFRQSVVDDPENQAKVLEFGFRPGNPAVPVGDPINSANGLNPSQPETELELPAPEVLVGLIDSWEQYRKRARVIMLLDVSGSMGDLGGEGFTKLDLAKEAVLGGLDEFQPQDEVGLWVFSTFLDGERDYVELVPPGPLRDTRADIEQSVQSLIADGGTGLYDSTAATVQAVRDGLDPSKINAVVLLSDGMCEDDPPGCELEPLLEFLGSSERETVRVFPVAYGEDADVEALQAIADATSARLYLATDPLTIERVFQSVISNF